MSIAMSKKLGYKMEARIGMDAFSGDISERNDEQYRSSSYMFQRSCLQEVCRTQSSFLLSDRPSNSVQRWPAGLFRRQYW